MRRNRITNCFGPIKTDGLACDLNLHKEGD